MSANWIFEGKCRGGPRDGQWMADMHTTVSVVMPARTVTVTTATTGTETMVRFGVYRWVDGVWEWLA